MRRLLAFVALLGPVPAARAADFTTSNVSSPAAGTVTVTDASPHFTATGTVTGGSTGTAIELRCYFNAGLYAVVGSGATTAAHTFSIDATAGTGPCRLRATPADLATSADPSAFVGPAVTLLTSTTNHVATGPNAGALIDAIDNVASSAGFVAFDSYGSFNSLVARLENADGTASNVVFDGVGGTGGSASSRALVQVDTHDAYAPYTAATVDDQRTGLLPLAHAFDATTTESDPLVRCADVCTSWSATGVTVNRSTTVAADGRTIRVADAYTSTDGASHVVSAWYAERFNTDGAGGTAIQPVFQLPGQSDFNGHRAGNAYPVDPDAAATVIVKTSDAGDPGAVQPAGALTFAGGLNAIDFVGPAVFRARFDRIVVPAGASRTISVTYLMDTSLDTLGKAVALEEDRDTTPSLQILTPVPGAGQKTVADTATVRGTASGGHTLTLTLDGKPVSIGDDGTWEMPVTVAKGQNSYKATLTNGAGNTVSASTGLFGATAVPVVPDPDVDAPDLTLAGFPKTITLAKLAKGITGTATCSELCALDAELDGTYTGAHIAKAGDVVLASQAVDRDPNFDPTAGLPPAPIAVTLKPAKKLVKKVRAGAKLRIVVRVADASDNRTTVSRTITVPKPKPKHKPKKKKHPKHH